MTTQNSVHDSDGEFELNLSLGKSDWGKIATKMTPDQIPGSPWSDKKVLTAEKSIQADEAESQNGKGTLKIVHGNYRESTRRIPDVWDSNEKHTQTEQNDEHQR